MNITRSLVITVTTAALLAGGAGLASASGETGTGPTTKAHPQSIADIAHRVDERATKLTARLIAAKQKIDANARLTAGQKATLDGDIATTLADIATAKAQVDAATTRAQLKAARPALPTVRADLRRLHADRVAIRAAVRAARTHQKAAA